MPIPLFPTELSGAQGGGPNVVTGTSTVEHASAVSGRNEKANAVGALATTDPIFHQHAGVVGVSDQQGVFGTSTNLDSGTGVFGSVTGAVGAGFGVRGETVDGVGVQGTSFGAGFAGKFSGNVEVNGFLTVNGTTINTQIDEFKREIEFLRLEVEALRTAAAHQLPQPQPQPQPQPHPTSKPIISVSSSGSGSSAAFTVSGSGFTPGATVRLRIVDDALHENETQASADRQGSLNFRFSLPCQSGGSLHFSATDGRPDPTDLTGILFSNTAQLPCP